MTRYVLANWKAHKTLAEAETWLDEFFQVYRPHSQVEVIIAPPALYLVSLRQKIDEYKIAKVALAAQDLSPFPLGAYTGAVAAEMLRDYVQFAILGHAERRRYFHETDQEIANKVWEAKAVNIKPIVCVDQPYARSQMAALQEEDIDDLFIAYSPVEAIGIDIPQSLSSTKQAIKEIQLVSPGKPILYGGSINKDNAGEYLNINGVAGLMVGMASLNPKEFSLICEIVSR